jgi:Flp pilus assembly protein TadD
MSRRIAIAAAFAAFSLAALAAPTMDEPTVSERIDNAHKAIASKSWRTAMFELNQALREEPRNPEVHNLLGYTYRVRPDPDLAKSFEHYNLALKYNPNHKGTLEYMGEAYLMDKKPEEAEKLLVRLETVCGNKTCPEYQELFKAIAVYKTAK